MKNRIASLTLVAAMTLALAAAALISQRAAAQCGLPGTPPCTGGGGDKQKRPTPTDTRVSAPTSTPVATSQVCVASTPDAAQLQSLCAALLPAGGAGSNPGPQQGPPPQPDLGTKNPGPAGFLPYAIGGAGGLLFGLIIVVLFPGLRGMLTITRGGAGGFGKYEHQWQTNNFSKDWSAGAGKVAPGEMLDASVKKAFDQAGNFGKVMPSGSNISMGQSGSGGIDGGGPNPGGHPGSGINGGGPNPGSQGGGGLGESSSN